jgi:hypothetical protein
MASTARWEWDLRPLYSHLKIPAEIHDAIMPATEKGQKDRAIVTDVVVRTDRLPR